MPTVRTGVLHVEPDGSQSLITITEPLKTRMFLDETCGHKFWEHECCCSSVLGATIDSMFGYSTTELIAAAELDLKLLQEELGVLEKDWKVVLKDPRTRRDKTHKCPKTTLDSNAR